jgi:hypothetical protein
MACGESKATIRKRDLVAFIGQPLSKKNSKNLIEIPVHVCFAASCSACSTLDHYHHHHPQIINSILTTVNVESGHMLATALIPHTTLSPTIKIVYACFLLLPSFTFW